MAKKGFLNGTALKPNTADEFARDISRIDSSHINAHAELQTYAQAYTILKRTGYSGMECFAAAIVERIRAIGCEKETWARIFLNRETIRQL